MQGQYDILLDSEHRKFRINSDFATTGKVFIYIPAIYPFTLI